MLDWQTNTALFIVLLASLALVMRVRSWLRSGGKTSCGACPNGQNSRIDRGKRLPLAQLSMPPHVHRGEVQSADSRKPKGK